MAVLNQFITSLIIVVNIGEFIIIVDYQTTSTVVKLTDKRNDSILSLAVPMLQYTLFETTGGLSVQYQRIVDIDLCKFVRSLSFT